MRKSSNTVTKYSVDTPKKRNQYASGLKQTKLKNEKSLKQIDSIFRKREHSLLSFTGTAPLYLLQDIVPYNLHQKISKICDSIYDAKLVLLKHKLNLSTVENIEEDCITSLDKSKKIPNLFYKREDKTSIGAYKVRGALYQASKIVEENPTGDLSFFAASTGNHALGVLKAAEALKLSKVTICVPENVSVFKKQKLEKRVLELQGKGINAKLLIKGATFEQTNLLAQELAKENKNSFYLDPYNNHNAVAGQGTIGLELLSQLDKRFSNSDKLESLTVIVPIGGGGLISGISCALKSGISRFPNLKKLKLNVIGVKLEDLNSLHGDAIKVSTVGDHNNDFISKLVGKQFKINDYDMKKGMDFISDDLGVKVEGAAAGTLKPIFEKIVRPSERNAVVCVLSGGNVFAG